MQAAIISFVVDLIMLLGACGIAFLRFAPKYREIRKAFIAEKQVEAMQSFTKTLHFPVMKFNAGIWCPFCGCVWGAHNTKICFRHEHKCADLEASHTHNHCEGCDKVWLEKLGG